MAQLIQKTRGMNDFLPSVTTKWQQVESIIRQVVAAYGYSEIRTPIIEDTALFKRSIGEVTDIVEKEMYTFADRDGDSITLRPEGTASCVRAGNQHGLLYNQEQRLWYMGPMFRYERPQKGRYRQFHQFGCEVFGLNGPDIDAEIIMLTYRLWKAFGIADNVKLELNSLGSNEARANYRAKLVEYLQAHQDKLDEDSKRRMASNPLRVLDSKDAGVQEVLKEAPTLLEYLDDESREHLDGLCRLLDDAGINYEINHRLVRGLDYYNRTVFEWVTTDLGAQGTICAGGRYDGLVEQLGGRATPAVGFAMGMERMILLLDELGFLHQSDSQADLYVLGSGEQASLAVNRLAEKVRDALPNLRVMNHRGGGNFKKQFKRADKSGAQLALIIGDDEVANNQVTIKYLRTGAEQVTVHQDQLIGTLSEYFV